MKKALALVLALVLALSMAVSAFAVELLPLYNAEAPAADGKTVITVVDAVEDRYVIYVDLAGTYYIALDDQPYTDVVVTANGCVDAKLVDYDPEKMVIVDKDGNDIVTWAVTYKGEVLYDFCTYETAIEKAEALNDCEKVTYYGITCTTNVNVIEIKVADNFSAHYEEGTIKIDAKLAGKAVANTLSVINDVTIFEYEMVKWAAEDNAEGACLQLGSFGYSDYFTAENGYGWEYDEDDLRRHPFALVVSTTAFRAIEGKDLCLDVLTFKVGDFAMDVHVELKDIVAGQKGVNFFCDADLDWNDKNADGHFNRNETINSVSFGFKGDQVVKGAYEIVVDLPIDYYELRELFGLKVEEDDIITYYVIDENGKVVCEKTVDYMTLDLTENVAVTVKGENDTLGYYTLCLEVPAVEESVEENPNTGAESVVGVVAALAVVSVATAAAVSLKK